MNQVAPSPPGAIRTTARAFFVAERLNTAGLERGDVLSTTPLAFRVGAGGVSVLFDDTPAPLVSAQRGEIWAIVPSTVAGRNSAAVTVRFNGGSAQTTAKVVAAQPGIFIAGGASSGQAIALNEDGTLNSTSNPAARGSRITFWATGQGATDPPLTDGQAATADPLLVPAMPFSVAIGGKTTDATAALSPGFVGLMQVTATIPAGAVTRPTIWASGKPARNAAIAPRSTAGSAELNTATRSGCDGSWPPISVQPCSVN